MAGKGYTIEWNEDDLRRFVQLTQDVYDRALGYVAQEVWGNIGREAPTDEGKLANTGNWALEKAGHLGYRIYTNLVYALFVHEGTGIYGPVGRPITPTRARFLVFEWQGRTWFLRSVKGQKPNPYADRAMESAEMRIPEFVQRAIDELGVGEGVS